MSWNKFYFVRKTDSGHVFSDCYGQSKTQVLHMNMDKFSRGVLHASTKPYFNELQFNMVFYDKSKIAHGIVLSHDVSKLMSFKLKDSTQGISIDVKVQDDTVSELYSTESLVKTRQQLLKTLKMMWDVATGKEPDIQVIVTGKQIGRAHV